jgi:hypothetical protein
MILTTEPQKYEGVTGLDPAEIIMLRRILGSLNSMEFEGQTRDALYKTADTIASLKSKMRAAYVHLDAKCYTSIDPTWRANDCKTLQVENHATGGLLKGGEYELHFGFTDVDLQWFREVEHNLKNPT